MRIKLQVVKDGEPFYQNYYEVTDAESFGRAFAGLWGQLREAQFKRETSIGALMDHLDSDVLEQLNGTLIRVDLA